MADKKVDSARALVAGGWRISLVSRCLRRRVWSLLRRQSEIDDMTVINSKRVYLIMCQNACCLGVNLQYRPRKGRIQVGWPSGNVTSGGTLTT